MKPEVKALRMVRDAAVRFSNTGEIEVWHRYPDGLSLKFYSGVGICGNLNEAFMVLGVEMCAYLFVINCSQEWPEHSGDPEEPILGYEYEKERWKGEQLRLRLSLIDYLIEQAA